MFFPIDRWRVVWSLIGTTVHLWRAHHPLLVMATGTEWNRWWVSVWLDDDDDYYDYNYQYDDDDYDDDDDDDSDDEEVDDDDD